MKIITRLIVIISIHFALQSLLVPSLYSSQDTAGTVGTTGGSGGSDGGWSDSPPGGSSSQNTTVATLITSKSASSTVSTPLSSNISLPNNHPFADLYYALTQLQGALLQSLNVYWTASTTPEFLQTCNFSNLPQSVDSVMQGQMGPYFGAAFMPTSVPVQIFNLIKQTLVSYVQGMTSHLTIDTYGCSQGNDFINFTETQLNTTPGTFKGNLAYVDQVWKNTLTIISTALEKFKNNSNGNVKTIEFIQAHLNKIIDSYTQQRYQTIINWYTSLVNTLANRFNPTLFANGFYSYTIIPCTPALTGYSNAFLDACSQLSNYYTSVTTPTSYNVQKVTLALNQQATSSSNIFTNPASFFATLQNTTLNQVGDICAYTFLLGIQRSNDRVANKTIPTPSNFTQLTYNTVQDVATFLTSNQTGALPALKFFPGTQLPASSDFYCVQQLVTYLTSYVSGALAAFNFDTALTPSTFSYDSCTHLAVSSYDNEGLQAPSCMVNALQLHVATHNSTLQTLQNRLTTLTTQKIATTNDPQNSLATDFSAITDVFQEIIITANAALDAQYWYTQSGNNQAAADYSTKATLLENCATLIKGACTFISQASEQAANQGYQTYLQAGSLLYNAASSFLTLNSSALNSYCLTLGSYCNVTAYQTLMNYYASYYKNSLNTYNRYLITPPSYQYSNGSYNFDVIPGYEKALFTIVYYIDQAISASIQGYQNQLSFFLSQKQNSSPSNFLSTIWPLQNSLLLLTNFQEAITPLLLTQPCAVTSENKALLCGIDYNIIQTTSLDLTDAQIPELIIATHDQYISTYPLFKRLDAIMNKYPVSSPHYTTLEKFTYLDSIFQLSANNLTFSQFFLLHQARLYTSVAQRLIEGKPFFWNEGDQTKSHGSAYALLLYAYAAAIYQHLGYTQHAALVNAMKHLLFSPALIANFQESSTAALSQTLSGKTFEAVNQIFREINALHTVLYLSPGDTTYFTFLQMLSRSITSNTTISNSATTLQDYGYADWLTTQTATDSYYPHLQSALMYYQGYVIATAKNDIHADAFLQAAQQQFNQFLLYADALVTRYTNSNNTTALSTQELSQESNKIKELLDLKDAYDNAVYQMEFLQNVFGSSVKTSWQILTLSSSLSNTTTSFFKGQLNIPGMIGDIYYTRATQQLTLLSSNPDTTIAQDTTDNFETIINYYTQAKDYYGIACITDDSYQNKFLEAQQGITNAYAYQTYLNVIPLYSLTVKDLVLPIRSTTPLRAFTSTVYTLDQASKQYTSNYPLYLYKERITSVPVVLATNFTQNLQDNTFIIKNIAAPLYSLTLSQNPQSSQDSSLIAQYVNDYSTMYTTVCSGKMSIGTTKIVPQLSYKASPATLTLEYEPLPPLPRFTGDTFSALAYYTDVCNRLYAASTTPINFQGQLLVPSNNLAGQDLITQAMLNAYLSRTIELQSSINALKQSPLYQTLQSASRDQQRKLHFYDYLPLYKSIQPLYEQLIAFYIATGNFLSNYGVSQSICADLISQKIIEWMQTNSLFICGTEDTSAYQAILRMLGQSTQQIVTYANATANAQNYISQANLIFSAAYEYFAYVFENTSDTPLTTTNVDTQGLYPDVTLSDLSSYMKWKDAGNYYCYAALFLQKALDNNPQFSDSIKTNLTTQIQTYYANAVTNFIHYATYCASLFCSNAYQECRCKDSNNTYNVVEVTTSTNPAYPPWDYPSTGLIPGKTPAQYYTYPICEAVPSNGITYPFNLPSTVYQGVASMETPEFTSIKSQCSQGQPSQYSDMYTTMQQTFLNSLYYYEQALNYLKNIVPTLSSSQQKTRTPQVISAITNWIVDNLNKNPVFCDPTQRRTPELPIIQIPVSSIQKTETEGHSSRVEQFVDSIACRETELSLANSNQLYLHTLRYWSSQPSFGKTLLQGILQWCTPKDYDIALKFITDVLSMFKSFYIRSYLPSIDFGDAQYQLQQLISTSQQDSSGVASGYF